MDICHGIQQSAADSVIIDEWRARLRACVPVKAWACAGGGTCPSENVVNCFCAFVVTTKRSIDELFMHYFSQHVVGFSELRP